MNELSEKDKDMFVEFIMEITETDLEKINEVFNKHYDNLKNILEYLLLQDDRLLITFEICNIGPNDEDRQVKEKIRNLLDNASNEMKRVLLDSLLMKFINSYLQRLDINDKEVN